MKHSKLLIILILLFLLVVIGIHIPFFQSLDKELSLKVYSILNIPLLSFFFNIISDYTLGVIWGIIIISFLFLLKRNFKALLLFLVGTGILEVIIYVIKLLLYRARPFIDSSSVIYLGTIALSDFGFPSGHTTLAFFTAYFLYKKFNLSRRIKYLVYLLAFLVGISRVALGAHYILDVIGGAILGTLFGILLLSLVDFLRHRK